ncbi:hypothetical protein BGZ96_001171 [Linnemannia gamsii]|uniref:Uncharacterized protein n=1 Tax=Linnemannia gamsii TaxID=64522 RepID=A0ABQ7KAP0_9FUNG|nr:hypothetical protein BGZ96_001171 [Linnemannia gamsii]
MRMFSRATSGWTQLSVLVLLTSFLATNNFIGSSSSSSLVSAQVPGFCAECETYAMVVGPCGGKFEPKDIAIDGTYSPLQSDANCVCKAVIQKLLWNCAKCMSLNGGKLAKSPPPQQYQMTCQNQWKTPATLWNTAYGGPVAPGTTTPLGSDSNPIGVPPPVNPDPATTGGSGGNGGTGTGTSSGTLPSGSGTGSAGESNSGNESSAPNGTAIGISLGIIGIAAVGGAAAVVMMKRRRRRHTPLELDDSYVGIDNQWEKPPRPQSPPMMPAPIVSGARAGGGGAGGMGRPSPFESRPGNGSVSGGGSVVGGYDGSQYDQQYDYHQGGGSTVVGSNYGDYDDGYGNKQQQYNNQGYGYGHHDQGYPPHDHQGAYNHDYGYDHPVPTSNAPYHGSR